MLYGQKYIIRNANVVKPKLENKDQQNYFLKLCVYLVKRRGT